MSATLTVDVWSDLVCPFCYIGKRRLEAALARFPRAAEVSVRWRAFELDTRAPARYPGTTDDLLMRKYGMSREQARAAHENVTALAAKDGLEYRFDRAAPGNTFDAHRAIAFARTAGKADALTERLMRAYFTEGVCLSERRELARLAGEVGLDGPALAAALEGDALADDVRGDERAAAELGLRGVPAFVLGGTHLVSGAQSADTILGALSAAFGGAEASAPSGDVCEVR